MEKRNAHGELALKIHQKLPRFGEKYEIESFRKKVNFDALKLFK